tara:strand:+ start:54 stop:524 length:471 start_codon:yes stop_codon:yes gene_type:complete
MADDAIATIQVQGLPDEIQRVFTSTMTVSPFPEGGSDDTSQKWYYKLSSVDTGDDDLMAGSFLTRSSLNAETGLTAIHANDLVMFLFIKNVNSSAGSIYVTIDGSTPSSTDTASIHIGQNEFFCARLPKTIVGNIHAVSSSGTVDCIVAALLDDVA